MGRKRHYSFRMIWRKYYEFILEGDFFYLAQKAYTTPTHNGTIEWSDIIEATYKNALRRGCKPRVVIVEEEFVLIPLDALLLIYREIYNVDIVILEEAIYKARECVKSEIYKGNISIEDSYRKFSRLIKDYTKGRKASA